MADRPVIPSGRDPDREHEEQIAISYRHAYSTGLSEDECQVLDAAVALVANELERMTP